MKKRRIYVGFIDLEKAYGGVNRETLWQVLTMNDVRGKLLIGITNRHVDSSACVRVKGIESERLRIDSGMIMSGLYHVLLAVQCLCGWSDEVEE